MEITIMDHLWAAPENGKNGSSSRTRYAISKYDETGNNLTAPSDITAPTQAYTVLKCRSQRMQSRISGP